MFLDTKTDEAIISLDHYIAKKRDVLKLQDEINILYLALCIAETEQLARLQRMNNLEGRIKSFQKEVFIGEVKPGEIPVLKRELNEALKDIELQAQSLCDQRESFCGAQDARSQINDEILKLREQLLKDLPALFTKRFHKDDPNMGKRGQIVWEEPDSNGDKQWRRQWKSRVFKYLFHNIVNNTSELHFMEALAAFFKEAPFQVRIMSGFYIDRSDADRKTFDAIGDHILVPNQLEFEDAFEEIVRRRVAFVS